MHNELKFYNNFYNILSVSLVLYYYIDTRVNEYK